VGTGSPDIFQVCIQCLVDCEEIWSVQSVLQSAPTWRPSHIVSKLVFWVVTPCGLLGRYQHFGRIYCPQDQHQQLHHYELVILCGLVSLSVPIVEYDQHALH
jgi:hypothetical protein